MENTLKFALPTTSLNSQSVGEIAAKTVGNMPMAEFYEFQNRILNFRKNRRYDVALYDNAAAIGTNDNIELFRKGINQDGYFANNEANTFKKTALHTNMPRDGEYENYEIGIIHQIEGVVIVTAGTPDTEDDGAITDPTTTTFSTTKDVFLVLDSIIGQFQLTFKRGSTIICQGLLEDFPMLTGISGVAGSSPSAFAQNMGFGSGLNLMTSPEVVEGDDDFSFEITPLIDGYDPSGSDDIKIKVRYSAWEFLRNWG